MKKACAAGGANGDGMVNGRVANIFNGHLRAHLMEKFRH